MPRLSSSSSGKRSTAPDAAFSEQQVLLGKEISAQWTIAVYYKTAC